MIQPFNKNGLRRVAKVPYGESVIAMTSVCGIVVVATGSRVYRLAQRRKGQYALVPIKFQEEKETT